MNLYPEGERIEDTPSFSVTGREAALARDKTSLDWIVIPWVKVRWVGKI